MSTPPVFSLPIFSLSLSDYNQNQRQQRMFSKLKKSKRRRRRTPWRRAKRERERGVERWTTCYVMNSLKKSFKGFHHHPLHLSQSLWSPGAGSTSTAPPRPPSLSASPHTIPQSPPYLPSSPTTLLFSPSLSSSPLNPPPPQQPHPPLSQTTYSSKSVPFAPSFTLWGSWPALSLFPLWIVSLQPVPTSPLSASISLGLSFSVGLSIFLL